MFADPYLLDKTERADLVGQLRECVAANPEVSELRVLFGMALCVNFEVPDAIEELREGVRLSPNSFIAHLKMGELWMRLRVMNKAAEHTQRAARAGRQHGAVGTGASASGIHPRYETGRNRARWQQESLVSGDAGGAAALDAGRQ